MINGNGSNFTSSAFCCGEKTFENVRRVAYHFQHLLQVFFCLLKGYAMKSSDIKVGVIGYGGAFNMGKNHLNEMARAGMTPVAVCDVDKSRLEVAKQDFPGIGTYSSPEEMLKKADVNLITIITPHNTHAPLAIKCLKAGKHVVSEKPLAITTAEVDSMIAAAKKSGVILSTYHNRHWDGCIMQAVKTIKTGIIGDIARIDVRGGGYGMPGPWWRSSKTISGGILYDWGVHFLEYTLQLMNAEIAEVAGYAKNGYWAQFTKWKDDTNEDDAFLVVRYSNGAWSTLQMSHIESNPKPMFEVTGTKGSYIMEHGGYTIITHKKNGIMLTTRGKNPPGEGWRFYQNIADHLTKNEPLIITPEWARRPVHILDLACRSAKAGKTLSAKYA